MKTFNPDWQQPGDQLYHPPAEKFSRQPMILIKNDSDDCNAAATWPQPFSGEEIEIVISYVNELAGTC